MMRHKERNDAKRKNLASNLRELAPKRPTHTCGARAATRDTGSRPCQMAHWASGGHKNACAGLARALPPPTPTFAAWLS